MKTSMATSISIMGILAAGAAAFAVNTAVLDFSINENVAVAPTEGTAATPVAASEAPSATASARSVQPSLPPITTPAPVTTQAPRPVTQPAAVAAVQELPVQTSTYKVGDAGRVILEIRNNSLYVANVLPAAGWKASRPDYDDGEVEVEFFSGSTEVEFKARLVNGEIKVFVESENEDEDDSYEREYEDDHDDNHDNEYERDDD